MDSDKILQA